MNIVLITNMTILGSILIVVLYHMIHPKKSVTSLQMALTLMFTQGGGMWVDGRTKEYKGVGITLNEPCTLLFNAIPGILLSTALYGAILILFSLLNVDEENPALVFLKTSNIFWVVVTLSFMFVVTTKITGYLSVKELHAARPEVNGRGIVRSKDPLEFQMIHEVERLALLWFVSVSETLIALRTLVIETGKQTVVSGGKNAMNFEFTAQTSVEKEGVVFAALEEKSKTIDTLLRNNLISVLTDLFQNLDIEPLLSMTGEEIYTIVYSDEGRSQWKNTKGEDFYDKEAGGMKNEPDNAIEKIFWKFLFQKQQLIILRFSAMLEKKLTDLKSLPNAPWSNGPKNLKEFQEQRTHAYAVLEEEFLKFRQAVLSSLGVLLKKDKSLGVKTSALTQNSLTFQDPAAQKAFQAEMVQKYEIIANDLQLDWINHRIKELKEELKKLGDKDALDFLLVTIGKIKKEIQDYNWNTTGSSKSAPKAVHTLPNKQKS